jgi:hypothetical protein
VIPVQHNKIISTLEHFVPCQVSVSILPLGPTAKLVEDRKAGREFGELGAPEKRTHGLPFPSWEVKQENLDAAEGWDETLQEEPYRQPASLDQLCYAMEEVRHRSETTSPGA